MKWPWQNNRRRGGERAQILDVKVRSRQLRVVRMKAAGIALGISFAVILLCAALWKGGGFALDQLLYSNPAFEIKHLIAESDGLLSPAQIQRWSGVKEGDNLMAVDLALVQRNLALVPLIKSAAVIRRPPETLQLSVTERVPIARVCLLKRVEGTGSLEPSTVYLDAQGYVLPWLPRAGTSPAIMAAEARANSLPSIIGLAPESLKLGVALRSPQIDATLQWVLGFQHSDISSLVQLQSIDLSDPRSIRVNTSAGTVLTFGFSDIPTQLKRWHAIQLEATASSQIPATIDLAVENYIPVRWQEPPGQTSPANLPKSQKSQPIRKRNV